MTKRQALSEITRNLKALDSCGAGNSYGYWLDNVRFPCYMPVLSYDAESRLYVWRHYGSSARRATIKELAWILEVIFKMTPRAFLETYHTRDYYENRAQ